MATGSCLALRTCIGCVLQHPVLQGVRRIRQGAGPVSTEDHRNIVLALCVTAVFVVAAFVGGFYGHDRSAPKVRLLVVAVFLTSVSTMSVLAFVAHRREQCRAISSG